MADATIVTAITLESALDNANPNEIPSALKMLALGTMLGSTVKQTIALAAVAAAVTLDPPALGPAFVACRVSSVVGGAGAAGVRAVTDAGGTPGAPGANGPGLATLSDDGKTLTFENTIKEVVVSYIAAPSTALSALFYGTPR